MADTFADVTLAEFQKRHSVMVATKSDFMTGGNKRVIPISKCFAVVYPIAFQLFLVSYHVCGLSTRNYGK